MAKKKSNKAVTQPQPQAKAAQEKTAAQPQAKTQMKTTTPGGVNVFDARTVKKKIRQDNSSYAAFLEQNKPTPTPCIKETKKQEAAGPKKEIKKVEQKETKQEAVGPKKEIRKVEQKETKQEAAEPKKEIRKVEQKETKQEAAEPKKEIRKVEQKNTRSNNTYTPSPLKKPDHAAEIYITPNKFTEYFTRNSPDSESLAVIPTAPKIPDLGHQMQLLNLSYDESINSHASPHLREVTLLSPVVEGHGIKMPPQFALLGHQPSITSTGILKQPLSTLVLQFNEYSSNISSQPSEMAFLSSIMPEYSSQKLQVLVTVLVSPSNFYNLKTLYSQIPGVQVRPFRLQPRHLNISTMLSLMSLGKGDSMPLYMSQVTMLLREMAIKNEGSFDYLAFRARLNSLHLQRTQTPFLDQRLDLLDSFLDLKGEVDEGQFVNNGITILDLSCPFVDQSTACILFRIAIDLFLHAYPSRGKMIVADEAHKQRHLGVRLIISTQEPTISPRLIDLCSMAIIHRFSSPEWYQSIQNHITIGHTKDNSGSADGKDGLYQISSLRTGEALVFAPSAHILDENQSLRDTKHKVFKLAVRKRITWDGGQSILCVN
ncbi:conserved hypothetical protein [Microsporum canis CBS 113480]|uniref:Uncharacterized protein n=1 Tax=Arthroderma otae (strain ATCC MYA-4605 / CBS 113480) TaxID=554155 RepID=C5FQS7_ARTOC|nr:conserved hypothetical protein [Microsporum canis CBS 113480]EEQ32230.1 conserved hypothetical protein [Microsporum canis CBS 113480]